MGRSSRGGRSRIQTDFVFTETGGDVLQRVNRGVEDFAGFVFSPAGVVAGVAAVGAGIVSLTANYIENTAATVRMAQEAGVGVREFDRMAEASNRLGVEQDTVRDIMFDMRLAISEATAEAGPQREAMEALGLSYEELNRLSPEDQLLRMTQALRDARGDTTAMASAAQLLGEGTLRDMNPLIDAGADALRNYADEAEAAGNVLDQSTAEASERARQNLETLNEVIGGLGNRVAAGIINWAGPIAESAGKAFGILPTEATTQAQLTEKAFTDRLTEALLAGATLGEALTDPVIQRLQSMAQSAGVNTRLAIAAVEAELRNANLENALRGFEGALYQGLDPQRAAELQAQNYPEFSIQDILTASAVRNPAFNAGGQTGLPEHLRYDPADFFRPPPVVDPYSYGYGEFNRGRVAAGHSAVFNPAGGPLPTTAGTITHFGDIQGAVRQAVAEAISFGLPVGQISEAEYAARTQGSPVSGLQGSFGGPVPVTIVQDPVGEPSGAAGGGFVGGRGGGIGAINFQPMFDISKGDPLRVSIAAFGGLEEGAQVDRAITLDVDVSGEAAGFEAWLAGVVQRLITTGDVRIDR